MPHTLAGWCLYALITVAGCYAANWLWVTWRKWRRPKELERKRKEWP